MRQSCVILCVFLQIQQVVRDRGAEEPAHLGGVVRLPEDPHELCQRGLRRHVVGLQQMQVVFQVEADVVDCQIAALILHLRGHYDGFSARDGGADDVKEAAALIGGKSAHAVALHDHCVVVLQKVGKQHAVRAGDHLHKPDAGIELVVEDRRRQAGRADILHQKAVLQDGERRIVDAGKRLQAGRVGLPRARAEDDAPVEDDHHAAQVGHRHAEGVDEIRLGVRVFKQDRLLRTGQNDRLRGILDQIGKRGGGVGHRVRAVDDDKAVEFSVVFTDGVRDRQPVVGRDIGRIQTE